MSEDEWFNSHYPSLLLEFLEGKTSDRKLRLYACACCRSAQIWQLLGEESRMLVKSAERFADQEDERKQLGEIARIAPKGEITGGLGGSWKPVRLSLRGQAQRGALAFAIENAWEAAREVTQATQNLMSINACDLIREIINPFGVGILADVRNDRRNNSVTINLAQEIYDEYAFDRMPMLADSLESSGYDNVDILNHLRRQGPHHRGCWALDSVLGKS